MIMESNHILTPSNIMFALGIIGMFFTIWSKVKDPQNALDKKTALDKEEIDGNATLLSEKLKWEREANEKRFADIGKRLDDAFALAQNHIHTVDEKLTGYIESSNKWHLEMSNQLW